MRGNEMRARHRLSGRPTMVTAVVTLLAILASGLQAPAATAASAAPSGDRDRVLSLWRFGGPTTKAAAAQALAGSDADVTAFLTAGHLRTEPVDRRLRV